MNKKKLKRYRLKINPEKGSTVDFISQVESPAIEVGFLKFNQEYFAEDKISFDFDDTLSTERGQKKAAQLIAQGKDVYVVSARSSKEGILPITRKLGIPDGKVFAVGSNSEKVKKVKDLNVDIHYDNNSDVVKNLGTIGVKFADFVDACWEGYKAKMASENNDELQEVFGPVLIPDLPIYRHSEKMGEYEIIFKAEDIKEIAMNFMKSGYQNNINLDHGNKMANSYVFESFVSSDIIPNPAPFEDLPIGTWFVRMKVEDPKVWQSIKEGKRTGFSIEGIFEYMVEEFEKSYKEEKQSTNILSEEEKLNLEKMIKDLFKKIFNELSQELDEKAQDLSDYQMVASSDYKIEARQVGQKVEIVDAEGNLMPAPDGNYEFEDGFRFQVTNGLISEIEGQEEMPEEEAMPEDAGMKPKSKQYMDMLADYPWDECMLDMEKEGYSEEVAAKICGSIKWKNMEKEEEVQMSADTEQVNEIELLKEQINTLQSNAITKEDFANQVDEIKNEFKAIFEKFSKIPAEPSKVSKSPVAKDIERQKFEEYLNTIRKSKK